MEGIATFRTLSEEGGINQNNSGGHFTTSPAYVSTLQTVALLLICLFIRPQQDLNPNENRLKRGRYGATEVEALAQNEVD